MADDDQPTGDVTVISAVTGRTYDTTVDDLADTMAQVTEDDTAATAAAQQAYLDGLDGQTPIVPPIPDPAGE